MAQTSALLRVEVARAFRLPALSGLVGALLSSACTAFAADAPRFLPAANYAAGDGSIALASGDLNGDQRPDLVVANELGDAVTVLIGNGDGSFQAPVHYTVGDDPRSPVMTDFNGDGRIDVAVADSWSDQISIFLGNGDGTLGSRFTVPGGPHPQGLATADVNGDGIQDLITADAFANAVGVLLGVGNGTFQALVSYPAQTYPVDLAVADLDHDGDLDLAVLNQNAGMSVLLGAGNGTFGSPITYGSPTAQAIHDADLNEDGHRDILIANGSANLVTIFAGNGDGSFQPPTLLAVPGYAIGVNSGDFNADNHADLAICAHWDNAVRILPGLGNGTFEAAVVLPVGQGPGFGPAIVDVTGDGNLDLVTANHTDDGVSVLINDFPAFGLSVGTVQACPGQEVSVPVRASRSATLGTLQFSMHWDPSVATFAGLEALGLPNLGEANFAADPDAGTLTVSWDDPDPAGTDVVNGATLFALRFTLIGPREAFTSVTIAGSPVIVEVTDAAMAILPTTWTQGRIDLIKVVHISGNVAYYDGARPVSQTEINLTGDDLQTVQTDAAGHYIHTLPGCADFTITPARSTEVPPAAGVSMLDAALIRLHVLGKVLLDSPFKRLAADVNASRTITTLDIRLIRQLVLDLRMTFPPGLWRFVNADYAFPDPLNPWNALGSRDYPGLAEDVAGQDYLAVKLGDANGSWGTGASTLSLKQGSGTGTEILGASKPVGLRIGSKIAQSGSRIRIGIFGRNIKRMTSAQFTIAWDPAVLRFDGVSGAALPGTSSECFGMHRWKDGILMFAWDDPQAKGVTMTNGDSLFYLDFDVEGPPGSQSIITLANAPTPREITLAFDSTQIEAESGVVAVARLR